MTRTSEQAERERRVYGPDNPDPRFNTKVAAVQSKLRSLSVFGDLHATEFLIDDLIWYYFVHLRASPTMLWRLLVKLHGYWLKVLRAGGSVEEEDARQLEWAPNTVAREELPEKVSLPPPAQVIPGGPGEMGSVLSSYINFDDKELRKRVRQVIFDHTFVLLEGNHSRKVDVPSCSCFKEFEFMEQWANHVRTLIWKELQG